MVSVIIPVYNVEKFIDKCINSIVNQTYKNIEIILINDGSTDKSGLKCLEWANKDKRVVVINKKNEGQGIARNVGIEKCKGEYITFVDADDWLEESAIEKMYKAISYNDVDIVTSDLNYVEEICFNKYKIFVSKLRIISNTVIQTDENLDLINKVRLFLCGKMYKKNLFLNNNLKQSSHAFEDTEIVPILVIKSKKIFHISEPLYYYLRNRQGSTVNSFKSLSHMEKSLSSIKKNFEDHGVFEKYYESLKKLSYSQVRFIHQKGKELVNKDRVKEYEKIKLRLYKFMDINYPDWFNINKYNIGIIGSDIFKKSVENLLFDKENIKFFITSFDLNQDILNSDIDLLFIDFFECNILTEEVFKQKLNNMLFTVNNGMKFKKTIIVKILIDKKIENLKADSIDELIIKYYNLIENKYSQNIKIEYGKKNNCEDELENEYLTWDISDEIINQLK